MAQVHDHVLECEPRAVVRVRVRGSVIRIRIHETAIRIRIVVRTEHSPAEDTLPFFGSPLPRTACKYYFVSAVLSGATWESEQPPLTRGLSL